MLLLLGVVLKTFTYINDWLMPRIHVFWFIYGNINDGTHIYIAKKMNASDNCYRCHITALLFPGAWIPGDISYIACITNIVAIAADRPGKMGSVSGIPYAFVLFFVSWNRMNIDW